MRIIEHQDMSKYTSFRAGGTCKKLVIPETKEELINVLNELHETGERFIVLGNGTNTLFPDGEYNGTVVHIGEALSYIDVEIMEPTVNKYDTTQAGGVSHKIKIKCGAGALLSKFAKAAMKNSAAGAEFCAGIPGSVGGAVFMNAGAYGGEIKDILSEVVLLIPPQSKEKKWEERTVSVKDLDMTYRHSRLQESGEIVVEATFLMEKGSPLWIEAVIEELAKRRVEKQPLEYPSAGSFFKRPSGYFAGKLIEDAGLKGLSVGGAQVSDKHSGFVINKGGATAEDIMDLMHLVQNTVMDKFEVMLEPEIRIVGLNYGRDDE